jgi:hypothetical protein
MNYELGKSGSSNESLGLKMAMGAVQSDSRIRRLSKPSLRAVDKIIWIRRHQTNRPVQIIAFYGLGNKSMQAHRQRLLGRDIKVDVMAISAR